MRFLPLVAGTAAATVAIRSTSDNIKCTDSLYVLVGRGTLEPAGTGSAGALADKIAEKVKGTVVGAVDYPASWTDPTYTISESEGATAVNSELLKYNAACPKAKIAYIGYSQVHCLRQHLTLACLTNHFVTRRVPRSVPMPFAVPTLNLLAT